MLSAWLPRLHDELVHALRVVGHVFAAAETVDCQSDGLVQGPRVQFDRMLNTIGIDERHPAPLCSAFISSVLTQVWDH